MGKHATKKLQKKESQVFKKSAEEEAMLTALAKKWQTTIGPVTCPTCIANAYRYEVLDDRDWSGSDEELKAAKQRSEPRKVPFEL